MSTPADIGSDQNENSSGACVSDAELARRHHLPTQQVPSDEHITIDKGDSAAQSAWHFVHNPWLLAYYLFGVHRSGTTRLAIRLAWSTFYGGYGVSMVALGQGGFYAAWIVGVALYLIVDRFLQQTFDQSALLHADYEGVNDDLKPACLHTLSVLLIIAVFYSNVFVANTSPLAVNITNSFVTTMCALMNVAWVQVYWRLVWVSWCRFRMLIAQKQIAYAHFEPHYLAARKLVFQLANLSKTIVVLSFLGMILLLLLSFNNLYLDKRPALGYFQAALVPVFVIVLFTPVLLFNVEARDLGQTISLADETQPNEKVAFSLLFSTLPIFFGIFGQYLDLKLLLTYIITALSPILSKLVSYLVQVFQDAAK